MLCIHVKKSGSFSFRGSCATPLASASFAQNTHLTHFIYCMRLYNDCPAQIAPNRLPFDITWFLFLFHLIFMPHGRLLRRRWGLFLKNKNKIMLPKSAPFEDRDDHYGSLRPAFGDTMMWTAPAAGPLGRPRYNVASCWGNVVCVGVVFRSPWPRAGEFSFHTSFTLTRAQGRP